MAVVYTDARKVFWYGVQACATGMMAYGAVDQALSGNYKTAAAMAVVGYFTGCSARANYKELTDCLNWE